MNNNSRHFHRRRGAILIYSVYLTMLMCAVVSLAVDYGRIQMIKTQEQRCADATARGILAACETRAAGYGLTYTQMANSYASTIGSQISAKNPVDANSGISPTIAIVVGSYYGGSFHNDSGSVGPLAIRVVVSRTTQTGNPVTMVMPIPNGKALLSKTCDVWAQSIALLPNPVTINFTAPATADPWLAGGSSGATASYDDAAPANAPSSITVIPGSTLKFSNVNGNVQHYSGDSQTGGNGESSDVYWHMKDPPTGAVAQGDGMQNNIGDITVPIDAMIGVFLTSSAPSSSNAPSTWLDFSTQAEQDQASWTTLELQQPFFIGTGVTSNGTTTKTYVVPSNATRFYLGMMDGYEWMNNSGQFTGTITEQPPIQLVQ